MNKSLFMSAMALICLPILASANSLQKLNAEKAPFQLPALPYATSDLAPNIDQATMELHHGKHHQAYINNINKFLEGNAEASNLLGLLQSTEKFPPVVRNNAGGHWNHAFFWTLLTKESKKTKMSSALQRDLKKSFGSVEKFKEEFEKQGMSVFGSGWVWLVKSADGKLVITTTANQDNPLMDIAVVKGTPLLALDVWEHAYYLGYQNRRAEYVKNFWNIVNWNQVSKYLSEK